MDRNHHSHVEQQTIFSLARRFREGADLAEKDITLRWINKVVASFATMKNAEAKANYPPPPLRSLRVQRRNGNCDPQRAQNDIKSFF